MKNFISIRDFSREELELIVDRALEFKGDFSKYKDRLKGRIIVSIFFENSTRTRASFEIAAKRMSAEVINIDYNQSSIKKGETDYDTIINLSSMKPNAFIIRHFYSGYPHFLSRFTNVPIINAGDGINEHPSQAVLDAVTMKEMRGNLEGLRICIIGDIMNSRVARSHLWMARLFSWEVSLFGPKTMLPKLEWLDNVKIERSLDEALRGKDFIMLLRIQLERDSGQSIPSLTEYSKFFGVNSKNMPFAYLMHPGPVNRNVELESWILDNDKKALIQRQVENGVFARMAVFEYCLI